MRRSLKTYTVGNLLPARPMLPFALVAEAVLAHVHEPATALLGQRRQRPRAVAQPLDGARPVPVDDDVGLGQQAPEAAAALLGLEVELGGALAHVAVDLEEGHVAETRRRDLEHVGPVLGQRAPDDGPRDDAAQLEHLDAGQRSSPCAATAAAGGGEWTRWSLRLELVDAPRRELHVCPALFLSVSGISSERESVGAEKQG